MNVCRPLLPSIPGNNILPVIEEARGKKKRTMRINAMTGGPLLLVWKTLIEQVGEDLMFKPTDVMTAFNTLVQESIDAAPDSSKVGMHLNLNVLVTNEILMFTIINKVYKLMDAPPPSPTSRPETSNSLGIHVCPTSSKPDPFLQKFWRVGPNYCRAPLSQVIRKSLRDAPACRELFGLTALPDQEPTDGDDSSNASDVDSEAAPPAIDKPAQSTGSTGSATEAISTGNGQDPSDEPSDSQAPTLRRQVSSVALSFDDDDPSSEDDGLSMMRSIGLRMTEDDVRQLPNAQPQQRQQTQPEQRQPDQPEQPQPQQRQPEQQQLQPFTPIDLSKMTPSEFESLIQEICTWLDGAGLLWPTTSG